MIENIDRKIARSYSQPVLFRTSDGNEYDVVEAHTPANCLLEQNRKTNENNNEEAIRMCVPPSLNSGAIVTKYDIVYKFASVFLQLFDIVSDWCLIVQYSLHGEWLNLAWTAVFVLVSSLINMAITMSIYNMEVKESGRPRGPQNATANKLLWCKYCWPIVLVLQLAPLFRWRVSLKHAQESYKYRKKGDFTNQKEHYQKMLDEDEKIAILRLVECFLEATPQLILQLSIMQKEYLQPAYDYKFGLKVVKIVLALITIGWCMTSFNRSMRLSQPCQKKITKWGLVFQFFWHFCITVSRIISVSIIASAWTLYACVWFFVHWLVMTIWMLKMLNVTSSLFAPNCSSVAIKKALVLSLFGVIFFFTHVNISPRPTFYRHMFYYTLCCVQNAVACYFWAHLATDEIAARWYFKILVTLGTVPFLLGILSMIVYYKLEPIMKTEDEPESANVRTEI